MLEKAIEKWREFPYSALSHHDADCCRIAREWILAMDFAQLNNEHELTAPRWIRQKYMWGACQWSLFWCAAVRRKNLDCGALAALSVEVFRNRGVTAFPVQMIQEFDQNAVAQWRESWEAEESSTHWLAGNLIYHEGCAVLTKENEIKIWDASAAWWINPNQPEGYGTLKAVKIHSSSASNLTWGEHLLQSNQWQEIKENANQ